MKIKVPSLKISLSSLIRITSKIVVLIILITSVYFLCSNIKLPKCNKKNKTTKQVDDHYHNTETSNENLGILIDKYLEKSRQDNE